MSPPGHPWVSTKNFSPINLAVWPAIGNIYTNVLFYYIDNECIQREMSRTSLQFQLYTRFYQILPDFTRFYQTLPDFIIFFRGFHTPQYFNFLPFKEEDNAEMKIMDKVNIFKFIQIKIINK